VSHLDHGGSPRLVTELTRVMLQRGHRVSIANLGMRAGRAGAPGLEALGVPIFELELGSLLDPRPALRLAGYIRREQIDLVHTHLHYANLVGRAAARLAGVPALSTEHASQALDPGWRGQIRVKLDHLTARHWCDRLVFVSDWQRELYAPSAGLPGERLVTLRNAVDVDRYRPDPALRGATRARLGLRPDELVAVVVAVLRPNKGIGALLRALASREELAAMSLLVVGDGPNRARLELLAQRAELAGRVRFLGALSDVRPVLAAADLFVLPSRAEALPLSLLEAMSAGLPVVASSVGGIPEVVEHDRTGLLVPPGDERALAAALVELLDQPLRDRLGCAARGWAVQNADIRDLAARYESLYTTLLGGSLATW
jgi:glycosyltransferase involved in cell wall biosynthesis